ncbi:Efflux pump [Lachnellula occidentalis]|uniref:Efflux pump n=1 Tax=Lachnellula occidentalis TaxID=215460 RepID=A0A8H8RJ40_9HELO|nr:Efflux pump [Lachnellula occidentalis]
MVIPGSNLGATNQAVNEGDEKIAATDGSPAVNIPTPEPQNVPIESKKPFKFKVTVFMLCLISVVVAMDSVIVASTLPAITVALKGTSLKAFWVGTSYLLAQTVSFVSPCSFKRPFGKLADSNLQVTVPIYGTISNIFGRKWVMIFATGLFLFGSILCGCAQNMNWLIAARVVQGLGGGGCLTLTTVIISDITTLRERPKFLAMGAFAWALGTNIGVPIGGAIGEYSSWRWVFWINIPVCVFGTAGLIYALHLHQEISSLSSKLARIDFLGMAVFIAATTLMLYGLTTGGTSDPWDSAKVLAPLIIGFVGLGVFVIIEWKFSKEPMVPVRIFSDRSGNTGFFGAFIHGLVLWAFAYYLIIFFLGARRDALFKSSAETLPGSAPVALSAVVCGIWVSKTLRFQKMTWLAWVLIVTGTGLNVLMKPDSNAGILFGLRVIPAIGAGFLFQLPVFAVQSTAKDDDLGIATATTTFFRSVGQAFGVAIGGTVFQNQFDKFLNEALANGTVPKQSIVTGAQAAGAYGAIGAFPEPVITAYRYIYADALRTVWYVITGIAGAGLLVSFLVRNESMDRGNNAKQAFKVEKESSSELV